MSSNEEVVRERRRKRDLLVGAGMNPYIAKCGQTHTLKAVAEYRYLVLSGDIQRRCRELVMQICDTEDVTILKGAVSKDHVHMHVEYPTRLAISELMKRLKSRDISSHPSRIP